MPLLMSRISSLVIFLILIVASIFFMYIFISTRIIIVDYISGDRFLFRSTLTVLPGILIQVLFVFASRRWQRARLPEKIPVGPTPFVQQVPYFIAFFVLYGCSAVTFNFLNSATGVEYFSRYDPALSMNYVIGNTLIIKIWASFSQHYVQIRSEFPGHHEEFRGYNS
jgi:hypothetical protein